MADQYIQVQPNSTGAKVDVSELTVNAQTVERQRVVIADDSGASSLANIVSGDTGNSALVVARSRKEVSFGSITASGAIAATSVDVSNYAWVSVQITSAGSGNAITFQCSNDNSNWLSLPLMNVIQTGTNTTTTVTGGAGITVGPLQCRYFRLNVTSYSSGTIAGLVEFFSQSPAQFPGRISVEGLAADAGTASGNPLRLGGIDGSSNIRTLKTDTSGNLFSQAIAGTANGWSVNSQTALSSTKTQLKSSAGNFGGYMLYNANTAVTYIQVWDVASASITVGTTAPTYVIPIPASAGANLEMSLGITHATAINVAATTTATGSTAPSSSIVGFFLYK